MLEGCETATLVSLEIDPFLKPWVQECLALMPNILSRHEIEVGPALDTLEKMPSSEAFDLVFIDANKSEYKRYVEVLIARHLLAENAMIVADNTLYCGIPFTPSEFDSQPERRSYGESIREFNLWVRDNEELNQVLLPIRDGVSIITYKPANFCSPCGGAREVKYYQSTATSARRLEHMCRDMVQAVAAEAPKHGADWTAALKAFLRLPVVEALLLHIPRVRVFTGELQSGFSHNLVLLGLLKKLKYWYVLPQSTFLHCISATAAALGTEVTELTSQTEAALAATDQACPMMRVMCREEKLHKYLQSEDELETADPHAVYPTSTYRCCDGHVMATEDASLIEGVMSTTLTTTIKILSGVLDLQNPTLREVYAPLGRCVAIVDAHVDTLHGGRLSEYFARHNIGLTKLVFRGMEADKGMETVESILKSLKAQGVSRNEPVLIVGGGVIADVGGFATALYHRNTPYVMLCTSIVSGIDAGPSPRTCCDGFGYKNLYGAYHPPVLTLTDRTLFSTLHPGWLRHGVAEIIKMAVVKDLSLFELLEDVGPRLIHSKFGNDCPEDADFCKKCDLVVGKAMYSYVQAEYGNLWETHQCRPHAYGHTWSPGYEIPAGMLHGHAVATGMGFGAYLAMAAGFIDAEQLQRVMQLISNLELSLWHSIMDDHDAVWAAHLKIVQKRGGHLCAPVPKGHIGRCGYIQDLSQADISAGLDAYKALCQPFPRNGLGIDPHCADVGLEDPSTVGHGSKDEPRVAALEEENETLRRQLAAAEQKILSLERIA
uniref:3-dehydroquinate synthase domain-containing protein n=1 Tax=Noctiluca scintillans TaxID=2966 RepID=A0A7S0ZTP8_NOCSC